MPKARYSMLSADSFSPSFTFVFGRAGKAADLGNVKKDVGRQLRDRNMRIEARSQVCRKLNSSGCSVYVQLGGNIPPPFFPFHKIFLCFLDKKGKECTHTVCKISRWNIQYRTAQPSSVVVPPLHTAFLYF